MADEMFSRLSGSALMLYITASAALSSTDPSAVFSSCTSFPARHRWQRLNLMHRRSAAVGRVRQKMSEPFAVLESIVVLVQSKRVTPSACNPLHF
jgi:hypothetical protein